MRLNVKRKIFFRPQHFTGFTESLNVSTTGEEECGSSFHRKRRGDHFTLKARHNTDIQEKGYPQMALITRRTYEFTSEQIGANTQCIHKIAVRKRHKWRLTIERETSTRLGKERRKGAEYDSPQPPFFHCRWRCL
jgi:hypothetical protein